MFRSTLAAMAVLSTLVPLRPAFGDDASPGLEEMELFQTVDRLADQFRAGRLPLGTGESGSRLYGHWRNAPEPMTEAERRRLYDRAIGEVGEVGGGTGIAPNGNVKALRPRSEH